MATEQQIKDWKEKYGFVYRANIDGTDYIFKTLTREDYMAISAKQITIGAAFDNELEVVTTCLLEPAVDDNVINSLEKKGGIVSVLSERIMLRSGFQQIEEEEL